MTKVQALWERMGGRVGLTMCLAGFAVIFLGWNGAAGYDRVPSQMPYLFGAIGGLGLVFVGAAMVVVEGNRQQRGELKASIEAVRAALVDASSAPSRKASNGAGRGAVVAGRSAYHRPECRLLEGRDADTSLVTVAAAADDGLTPCRICQPT